MFVNNVLSKLVRTSMRSLWRITYEQKFKTVEIEKMFKHTKHSNLIDKLIGLFLNIKRKCMKKSDN